ncbi:MAG: hypothetical protein K6F73_03695, partial [Lachnospiraceae bacterium]|nr:hypothetical protein [Lachnospiraceae bacterium]
MSPLETFITEYLAEWSAVYFIRQYIVLLVLFVFGAILSDLMLGKDTSWIKRSLLAFPLGVSAFIVSAYAMLVIGIPYNTMTVSLIW